ncbi:MAG: chorismate-binding protein [Pricia sp.]
MDFLERINAHFHKKLPFVLYRKPKTDRVKAIFQNDDKLHTLKSYSETGFIFAPFDAKRQTVLLHPDEISEIAVDELIIAVSTADMSPPASEQADKRLHLQLIANAIDEIEKGNFEKVVLSRRKDIPLKVRPIDLFKKLLAQYQQAFCYLWYHPKVGLWLGATPEILLMLKNRQLVTMSLAGTQPFAGTEHPEWGRKEREEQQLVTDYIINALKGRVERIEKTDTETLRAGNLLHLRTKITGLVIENNLRDIVEALHPTPAVCGMPKGRALNFIFENENYNREYYTGFLGELNLKSEKQRSPRRKNQENQAYRAISNTTTLYVNLRCMQLKDNKALLYVGGGITIGSDPEKEWEETVAKSKTMSSILE